jgi:hypothetical protein
VGVFLDHNQSTIEFGRILCLQKYGFGECIMMVRAIWVFRSQHHLGKLLVGSDSNLAFNQQVAFCRSKFKRGYKR